MFGFGEKYCVVCGVKVQKGSRIETTGKDFCSEQHAHQYAREMRRARQVRLSRQLSQSGETKAKNQKASHGCH